MNTDSASTNKDHASTLMSSRTSVEYFNAIDKAHEILEGEKDLAKVVPSCAVVGMQSVGKSAVLSRISKISFPQDSEVCTRVAIELRLRGMGSGASSSKKDTIMIRAGQADPETVDANDKEAIQTSIKDAQEKVLNGRPFEDKYSVKIEKQAPNIPEISLVDLPGVFFAKGEEDDHLEKQVQNMINEKVKAKSTLILHVIPLNQDTDTLSTWRTVNEADPEQARTISIFTKADLALKDGQDILRARLEKILSLSKTSKCFIVHGAVDSEMEEQEKLSEVSSCILQTYGLSSRIKVGINDLNSYIEERMLEHIKGTVGEMKDALQDVLESYEKELSSKHIGRFPMKPAIVLAHCANSICSHMSEKHYAHLPSLRQLFEKFANDVAMIEMEPLGIVNSEVAKHYFDFYDDDDSVAENDQKYMLKTMHLALEAKEIADQTRHTINIPFVGYKEHLKKWLCQFETPFAKTLQAFVSKIYLQFEENVLESSLEECSTDLTKYAIKDLKKKIQREIIKASKAFATESMKVLTSSVSQNTFTTDVQRFNIVRDEIKKKDKISSRHYESSDQCKELEAFFEIIFNVKAFIKLRKIMLPDMVQMISLKVIDDLVQDINNLTLEFLASNEAVESVRESDEILERREYLLKREKKIKAALEEIEYL